MSSRKKVSINYKIKTNLRTQNIFDAVREDCISYLLFGKYYNMIQMHLHILKSVNCINNAYNDLRNNNCNVLDR